MLPGKAIRPKWPHVLWILPSTNSEYLNNGQRSKFTDALMSVTALHANMTALSFGQAWNYNDRNIYLKSHRRFTAVGLSTFWEAFDKTVRYCHAKVFNNPDKTCNFINTQFRIHRPVAQIRSFNNRQNNHPSLPCNRNQNGVNNRGQNGQRQQPSAALGAPSTASEDGDDDSRDDDEPQRRDVHRGDGDGGNDRPRTRRRLFTDNPTSP